MEITSVLHTDIESSILSGATIRMMGCHTVERLVPIPGARIGSETQPELHNLMPSLGLASGYSRQIEFSVVIIK